MNSDEDYFYIEKLAVAKPITQERPAKIQWNWRRVYKGLNNKPKIKPNFRPAKESKEWREAVLRRTGNVCIICNSSLFLEAHHIESYHSTPELRFDIDNGVALCHDHHKEFHSKFGIKNNTLEQWNLFYSYYK